MLSVQLIVSSSNASEVETLALSLSLFPTPLCTSHPPSLPLYALRFSGPVNFLALSNHPSCARNAPYLTRPSGNPNEMSSKKSFLRHREAEEARKKREEDEAARVYAEFVESFKSEGTPGSKTFVRGGFIDPNRKHENDSQGSQSKEGMSLSKKGSRYVPSFLPPSSQPKEPERKRDEEKPKEKEKGKTRAIDKFLEELKYEQEMREKRNQEREARNNNSAASASSSHFDETPDYFDLKYGSFDDGDPQTTNLYVGNLSPKVDENFLLRTFGRFGPIASVKIMWPRTEEERRRQRNCGFVAFMNRADGQAAKDEMQGVIVYDYELKIGWGKSVALPSQALPAPPPGHMAIRNQEGNTVILSGPGGPPIVAPAATPNSELVLTPNIPDIVVVPPEDDRLRHVIDTMALHVLDGGCAFEQAVMERGRGNPLFSFLFDLKSKEHTYYVWRLYSFAQGDTLQRWRTEPFIMITGSGRWMPPALSSTKSPEHTKEISTVTSASRSRRVELERTLTDSQRDEFEDMLRSLTLERSQIKAAMGFSLDNADAAGEIVEVLTESLTLKETPIPTKVARLMLVSDILHNSSAPVKNASAFRTKFEAALPDIMESFNDLYRSVTGRITAEALKERVLKVLQVWGDWFLFSDAFLNGLRATFLRSNNSGVVLYHSLCGDAPEIDKKGGPGDLSDDSKLSQDGALAMGQAAARKELLDLPLVELERRCRHNGLSLAGGREMMVARLLNLEEAERDNNAAEMKYEYGKTVKEVAPEAEYDEEEVEEVEEVVTGKRESADPVPILTVSKWARDDDVEDVGEGEERKVEGVSGIIEYSSESEIAGEEGGGLEVAKESSVQMQQENAINEEQRQKLRRLEVAVMEYRESLEERGMKNTDDIEKKVAAYRQRLESEFGLSQSNDGKKNSHLSEKTSTESKERSKSGEKAEESSRKRPRSRSRSPRHRSSERERGRDRDYHRDRERDRDRGTSREKSASRERDDRRDRDRDRDRRRR